LKPERIIVRRTKDRSSFGRLNFICQQLWYDLYTGFLMRPALITLSMALLAIILVTLEKNLDSLLQVRYLGHWVFSGDVSSAQAVLGTIASSMITVVSIIYSVLVMSLTLASTQFSPRILHEFVRDRASQNQLGIFIGTFAYCHITLLSIEKGTKDFVPEISITMGVVLALVSLGYLIYFIHHIAQFIQVNYLIDVIARQTEEIIKAVHHRVNHIGENSEEPATLPEIPQKDLFTVLAGKSGYIQLVDERSLMDMAASMGVSLYVQRAIGDFVTEGNPLLAIHPASDITPEVHNRCLLAFDIGPVRTMQQDIEFGIRQIVDVALKAISPAVNDPTTASTCIDHLGRILTLLARQKAIPWGLYDKAEGRLLLSMRRCSLKSSLDLGFNQLRQYGSKDSAVLTALMRVLAEMAQATERKDHHEIISYHANLLENIASKAFEPHDRREFQAQAETLHTILDGRSRENG
jgi:uncharacterized membrane protein